MQSTIAAGVSWCRQSALPLAAQLGLPAAPTLHSRTKRRQFRLTATRLHSDRPLAETRASLPIESAWAAHLHLRGGGTRDFWINGKAVPAALPQAGTTDLHDLRHQVITTLSGPLNCIHFHLPLAALAELADELGMSCMQQFELEPEVACADPVIHALGLSLLPAFEHPEHVNTLFIDHIALAFSAHVAQTYGGAQARCQPMRGGLTPWQERRAKEMMEADLEADIALADIASACGLSTSYFPRAFKQSTGLPPHQWLLRRRVEKAQELMRTTRHHLAEISMACGFADQSHFGRVFAKHVGMAPGAWQRLYRTCALPAPRLAQAS